MAALGVALLPLTASSQETVTPDPAKIAAGLPEFLAGKSRAQVIVRFVEGTPPDAQRALIAQRGLAFVDALHVLPVALVEGRPMDVLRLTRAPSVAFVEPNSPLDFDMDTAVVASRAKAVWDADAAAALGLPALVDDAGAPIDGRGVTVAVVDTGVNALHPDLPYILKVKRNVHVVALPGMGEQALQEGTALAYAESPTTGGTRYHGQHVAGIVAGLGTLSDGLYRGSAPGASLLGFGDDVGLIWYGLAAWQWVYAHASEVSPPVRIVTNSWGIGWGPCEPQRALTLLQEKLIVEKGIVMTFSAGNAGGTGSTNNVRTQAQCGMEGAIGVASMDDLDAGSRDGPLADSSSRGLSTDPVTWPDVSAPGVAITSVGPVVAVDQHQMKRGVYLTVSGTSMATPHVAGVIALMLQANPALTPAEVECVLEQTAHKFQAEAPEGPYAQGHADARFDGSNFARGHGLVDAHASVQTALDLKHGTLVGAALTCQGADAYMGARV